MSYMITALAPLRLALAPGHGLWFGILVDDRNRLAATGLYSSRDSLKEYLTACASRLTGSDPVEGQHMLAEEMVAIFEGTGGRSSFHILSERVTSFQKRVYDILLKIPRGKVTTYGRIASLVGSGPRAVGTAVASNPWPLFVPCHRVVPQSLGVGNYSMNGTPSRESSEVKRGILEREGVQFQQDGVSQASIWTLRKASR